MRFARQQQNERGAEQNAQLRQQVVRIVEEDGRQKVRQEGFPVVGLPTVYGVGQLDVQEVHDGQVGDPHRRRHRREDRALTLAAQIDRIFKTSDYAAPRFGLARWLPDGTAYAIVERAGNATDIVRYDAATGARSVLVAGARLTPYWQFDTTGVGVFSLINDTDALYPVVTRIRIRKRAARTPPCASAW